MRYKIHMHVLAAQDAFFLARRTRKDSPHTTAAYQRDLQGVNTLLAETL
ncbi:MAG TPA: integrase, partial [Lentzea sp.]